MAAYQKQKNYWAALTSRYAKKFVGFTQNDVESIDHALSPQFTERIMRADGSGDTDCWGGDQFDHFMIGGVHEKPTHTPFIFRLATNAGQATQRFFVADQPYEIRAILLSYGTADGAANTATITKEVAGQAPGAGVAVMTNTFNLNTTTNTPQAAVLAGRSKAGVFGPNEAAIAVNTGEMLSLSIASAVTNLAGLVVTVFAIPTNNVAPGVWNMNANGSLATQAFYLANHTLQITGVQMVWSAAGTDAGAVTIDVTHDTGSNAPGAGTSILSAAQSAKGTANVPVNVALTATASLLSLAAGDRLSVKFTGTLTTLAGVVVVVSFAGPDTIGGPVALIQVQDVMFWLQPNGSQGTNQSIFIADRNYQIDDVSLVYSTAGSGNVTITVDSATTAPGGGTSVLTDNSNAGPLTTAAANGAVVGTPSLSKRTIFLPAGQRLSVKYGGTLGTLAGLVVAVSMLPR